MSVNRPWAQRKLATISAAFDQRLALLKILAPDRRCRSCNVRKRAYASLQIDHIDPTTRTWVANKLNRWSRTAHYWRDYENGIALQALCARCNRRKGRKESAA